MLLRGYKTCLWYVMSIMVVTVCSARTSKLSREEVPPTEIDSHGCQCVWTEWMNNKDYKTLLGDDNTFANLRRWYDFCDKPRDINCREKYNWAVPFHLLHTGGEKCDVTSGLKCVSRPYNAKKPRRKPFYCDDFEITVQCCHCPTTTTTTSTAVPTLAVVTFPPDNIIVLNRNHSGNLEDSPPSNSSSAIAKEAPPHDFTVTVILLVVLGCAVIAAFIVVIWLILWKSGFNRRKRIPRQDFYHESPIENYSPIKARIDHASQKSKVAFVSSSGSVESSDYATSTSEDEGYRSRPSYSRKRKTKGERNRKLNGSRSNAGDSFELAFPSILKRSSVEESSDEGKFRRWFPDEYERGLQQKRNQPQKAKNIFSPPFTANNRKSIPYMDDLES